MNNEINSFIEEYRNALGRQRDMSLQALENERRNQYQNIMSNANKAGMMYSNFPERTKMQYDTSVYEPNVIKAQTAYQTGLDTLRNNVTSTYNKIKELQELTGATNQAADPKSNFYVNDANDYAYWDNKTGTTQFRNSDTNKIRFGTAAERAGLSTNAEILDFATRTLKGQDELNRLNDLLERAKESGLSGFAYNTGKNFEMPSYNFLDEAENDFLGSLGLKFQ